MIHLDKFETNITSACTNRCICCDHYSPMQEPYYIEPEELRDDLQAASRIMHADDYRLIGGEPTLHPELMEIVRIAKESGVSDTVSVWTNGMLLKKMSQEFWDIVDGITVTIYPKLKDLEWIKEKCQKEGMKLQIVQHPHFNRTFSALRFSKDEAKAMYRGCTYRSCNEYDNGWFYHCNNGRYIARLILGLPEGTDGINLYTATEAEFRGYLEDKEHPFQSCHHCVQTKLIPVSWQEVSREDWREASEWQG